MFLLTKAEQAKSESIDFDLSIHPSVTFLPTDNPRTVRDRELKFGQKINLKELKGCGALKLLALLKVK